MREYKTLKAFDRDIKRIKKRDLLTYKKIHIVIVLLLEDPFNPKLKSHKVKIRNYGEGWSTRVTGDIRIGWIINSGIIVLITVGTHDEIY